MATRKKAKPKRKKTPHIEGRKRRKTIGKASAIRKKAAKKASLRRASAKKITRTPRGTAKHFTQRVESLEVDHKPVLEVGPNDDFGLKVSGHAREDDVVFKVRL
jgi:hypothetical protein